MAHSKSRSRHWASPRLMGLASGLVMGAAVLAAPVQAGCEGSEIETEVTTLSLGQPSDLRPVLRLTLADAQAEGLSADPLTLGGALLRDALRLRLSDVTVSSEAVTGFRIFLNAPRGVADLTAEDPSFAGSVAFFPIAQPGMPAGSFVLDLDQALDRSLSRDDLRSDALVTLTLVPIGPADAAIGLGGSELLSK